MSEETKTNAIGLIFAALLATLVIVGSAAIWAITWNVCGLDTLIGLDPSFLQWIGLTIFAAGGTAWLASIADSAKGDSQ
jgi:hypothetical protein